MTFITVTELESGNKKIIRSEDVKSVFVSPRNKATCIVFTAMVPGEDYNEGIFVKESIEEIQNHLQ